MAAPDNDCTIAEGVSPGVQVSALLSQSSLPLLSGVFGNASSLRMTATHTAYAPDTVLGAVSCVTKGVSKRSMYIWRKP